MFDTVCSYPLSSDLFAQAVHPTEPLVSVGLSSGHVQTFHLPPPSENGKAGYGHIDTVWQTKRHKGSCRSVAFGIDGESLYSAGSDGWVKAARTETGKVEWKFAVPRAGDGSSLPVDSPSLIHALSPQTLLLATDSGALHLFDARDRSTEVSSRPQQTHHPHDDYVSSLTPLPPSETSTSGYSKQWVTTGGTTIAVTDLRRGVLVRSEDQGEELVSSAYVTGLKAGGTSKGEKLVVGGASGVLTLWEKGAWDDQDERIVVDRSIDGGESLEVITNVPDNLGHGKIVAVGLGDGHVRFVQLGSNKVISDLSHDDIEGVVGLEFDVQGRMISGGGTVVKVWHEAVSEEEDSEEESDDEVAQNGQLPGSKRKVQNGKDSDDDEDDDSSEEMNKREKTKRKKRKRGKGKDTSNGVHVMAFNDLD
ncbi:WD repeat-containing protein jip5 [Ophidiomyces ophidiicola]|nr:WD repeat-containing protein jip5 [Ophidiomyces ophidiicola]KAI1961338.1 WD repeat-containing protein jip5 [Ophidiomyces ophidiicola]